MKNQQRCYNNLILFKATYKIFITLKLRVKNNNVVVDKYICNKNKFYNNAWSNVTFYNAPKCVTTIPYIDL